MNIFEDSGNLAVVKALYQALQLRDAHAIEKILAAELEWWYHGPPSHQFLMHLLTGKRLESHFGFEAHRVSSVGPVVLAEGFDQSRCIAWVHAWTVTDGIVTQVREYFNTSLTVTQIGNSDRKLLCSTVWESSLPDRLGKSLPGIVLTL